MAEKRRFLDVWIIESNTVYREVPFETVTDWVQQGRLLADDMLRWSGKADWFKVGSTPLFAAYMPQSQPYQVDDQAEALEVGHMDFGWKQRPDEDEGDVDMIPLIDVSLVLLIFFMMTTTGAALSLIKTPPAEFGWVTSDPELLWVGISQADDGTPEYSLGVAEKEADRQDEHLSEREMLRRFDARLAEAKGPARVNIRADENLPSGIVRDLTVELEKRRARIERKFVAVSEPK